MESHPREVILRSCAAPIMTRVSCENRVKLKPGDLTAAHLYVDPTLQGVKLSSRKRGTQLLGNDTYIHGERVWGERRRTIRVLSGKIFREE